MAWQLHQSEVCPGCGTIDEEWRDPETKRLLEIPPYEVVTHTCAGCEASADMGKELEESNTPREGLSLRIKRADPLDYLD